jgi:outer membrane protein OmpA-like peptidoglycan-associated protein
MDKYAKQIDDVMAQLPSDVQRVYMVGHTDSRGTNAYNEVLSTNRVNEVAKYITEKYPNFKAAQELYARGEYELTNKCADGVDCDPYAHFLNRRVEVWFY